MLMMPDTESAVAHAARSSSISTASTPVYLRPLERGADLVLHSATKYLGGHDVLLGALPKDEADAARPRWKPCAAGHHRRARAAWLLSRSPKTPSSMLPCSTANEIVRRLSP